MDSAEEGKLNAQLDVIQNRARDENPNGVHGASDDDMKPKQKPENCEVETGPVQDSHAENNSQKDGEMEDVGPDISADDTTMYNHQEPLRPEDIHLVSNEGTVALPGNQMNVNHEMSSYMQCLALASQTNRVPVNIKDYKVTNSPGATVAETIIKNKTVVIEEKPRLSRLIDYTKGRLEKFNLDALYETKAIKSAKNRVGRGVVWVEGPEKSGKTTTALYLMKRCFSEYTPIYISKSDDLQVLSTVKDHKEKEKTPTYFIICIDDLFALKDDMRGYVQDVLELVNDGSAHLIVTTSDDVRKIKRQADYVGVLKDKYRTKLSEFPLEEHERYEILRCKSKSLRHLKHIEEGVKEQFLQEIAKSANYPWFLQILDELDDLIPTHGAPLVSFFKHPTHFLVKQVKEMYDGERKEKFFALVMIMKHGSLKERSLKSPDSPNSPVGMDLVLSLTSLLGFQLPPLTKVREAAKEMVGEYVELRDKSYVFIHESMTEAVCRVLFEVSPDDAIKWCPLSFIVLKTEIVPKSLTDNIILDEPEQIELLKERFLGEGNVMEVLKHQAFSDPKFVSNIIKELNIKSDQYKDILLQAITLRQLALVREITQNILRTLPETGDYIKPLAMEKACEVGNFEAYDELTRVGIEPNIACMKACEKGLNQRIISDNFEKFSSMFCQLSYEVMRDWSLIVAEAGNISILRELIEKLQVRQDSLQLIAVTLEKIIRLKDYEKYKLIVGEIERSSLDWGKLIVAASEGGQKEIIQDVLRYVYDTGIDINLQVPFVAACKKNQCSSVEILYEFCACSKRTTAPQTVDGVRLLQLETVERQTILQVAAGLCHSENPDVLQWLLKKKDWDPETADTEGSTALHTACHAGNITSVVALLKAGFKPLAVDKNGNTSLHTHLNGKFINKPIVLELLRKIEGVTKSNQQRKAETEKIKFIVSVQNKVGNTPLHMVAMQQNPLYVSIMQTLVEAGKECVNTENIRGQTPLHTLIASGGPPQAVDILLVDGFDLMKRDKDEQTVLHLACLGATEDMITKMANNVKKSPQILECRNANGWTPLHCYVSTCGNNKTVHFLCTDKNINERDIMDQTALHIAVTVPGNSGVVDALLARGSQIHAEDNRKQTALHVLCKHSHSTSVDLAHQLLQHRANIHAHDHKHQTPLHHACLSEGPQSSELADMLVSHGAMIFAKDIRGNTPLHSCCVTCCDQSAKVLRALLKHLRRQNLDQVKQAIMTQGDHGDTPLHKVCLSSGEHKREIAKILIDEGADVSLTNDAGDTVIDISRRNGITDITQLLIETTLISSCFDREKLKNVSRVLSCELSPDMDNENRLSQMMQTVLQTDGPHTTTVLELLIGRGADVKRTTAEGYTVIHLAAMTQGEFTSYIIGYLITKGADIFQKDQNGETALHKVSKGQTQFSSKLIKFLCENGLSAEEGDDSGNTPLHTVFVQLNEYYKECMVEIVSLSCDVGLLALNAQRQTPCDLASSQGHKVIGELFETYCTKRRVLNLEPLQHLKSRGANINSLDSEGNTVLHRICMKRVTHVCNNVKLLLNLGVEKTLYNKAGLSAFDLACQTGLDEDVRELTVVEMPDDLDTDGASAASTPIYSRAPSLTRSPQPSFGRPEWFRRSSSTESWEGPLRAGMAGIRNAAGMAYFDRDMEEFEQLARYQQETFFKRHM